MKKAVATHLAAVVLGATLFTPVVANAASAYVQAHLSSAIVSVDGHYTVGNALQYHGQTYIDVNTILHTLHQDSHTGIWDGVALILPPYTLGDNAVPSTQTVNYTMGVTIEQGEAQPYSETFEIWDGPVTVEDGHGGHLTAYTGWRTPSADGLGYSVFFWHNNHFIGFDSPYEHLIIRSLKAADNSILVTYENYRSTDAAGNPTLPNVTVRYMWNGHHLVHYGNMPSAYSQGAKVEYTGRWN